MDKLTQFLSERVKEIPTSYLYPRRVFVAASGVLTISFEGWPNCICDLKTEIDRKFPHLEKENFGSKWPKITIAALADGEELSKEEFEELVTATKDFSTSSKELASFVQPLSTFSAVYLQRRDLKLPAWTFIYDTSAEENEIATQISQSSKEVVEEVMEEDEDETYYDNRISTFTKGISHYTAPCEKEATLVAFVRDNDTRENLEKVVGEWKQFLQHKKPEIYRKYVWLDLDSAHVTIRALVPLVPDTLKEANVYKKERV